MEYAIILIIMFLYFSIDNNVFFDNFKDFDVKKESVLALKLNVIMFIISLYYSYKFYSTGGNIETYMNMFKKGSNETFLLHLSLIFLMAGFFSDSMIGIFNYDKEMRKLDGYIHHIVYFLLSIIIFGKNLTEVLMLYLIIELPTILKNLGKVCKDFRNDKLFGITFFIFRIIYMVYITYKFKSISFVKYMASLSISIHVYWFYQWFQKYHLQKD
jgi:hypothetical protein